MVAWSALIGKGFQNKALLAGRTFKPGMLNPYGPEQKVLVRFSHDRTLPVRSSKWTGRKLRDMFHYYIMIGAIPLTIMTTLINIFIGPATLAPIPEGYVPKHWEYYEHPVTRFLARYCYPNPQQDYEKYLHGLYEADEEYKIERLDKKIRELIRRRRDYKAWYHRDVTGDYARRAQEQAADREVDEADRLEEIYFGGSLNDQNL